ncbi:hypothetical protein EDC94DRAFT_658540 [Helicostylum pulchrum]|nr:hypothetical protein EDC94DRAFT_658540 [Helicostylum pulchrum]
MPNVAHGDILKLDIQFDGGYSVNAAGGAGGAASASAGVAVVVFAVNMTGKNGKWDFYLFCF